MAQKQKSLDSCRYVIGSNIQKQAKLVNQGQFPKWNSKGPHLRSEMKRKILFFTLVLLKVRVDDKIFYGLKIKIPAFRCSAHTTGDLYSIWEFNWN